MMSDSGRYCGVVIAGHVCVECVRGDRYVVQLLKQLGCGVVPHEPALNLPLDLGDVRRDALAVGQLHVDEGLAIASCSAHRLLTLPGRQLSRLPVTMPLSPYTEAR